MIEAMFKSIQRSMFDNEVQPTKARMAAVRTVRWVHQIPIADPPAVLLVTRKPVNHHVEETAEEQAQCEEKAGDEGV